MIPHSYRCSQCREQFEFGFRCASYYVGSSLPLNLIKCEEVLEIPVRPAWCQRCECVCIAEDIAPLRVFEAAYGTARRGKPVEYPVDTAFVEAPEAARFVERYLRWRLARRHSARALCCGGVHFQLLDVATPLIKHTGCEFGFINPQYVTAPFCGPASGVRRPANTRLYSTEGDLIGRLTWLKVDDLTWVVEPDCYPPADEE